MGRVGRAAHKSIRGPLEAHKSIRESLEGGRLIMGRGGNRPEAARLGLPWRKAGGAALIRFFLQAGGPLKVRQTGNSDGRQDEKRRTEEALICLTVLFPK